MVREFRTPFDHLITSRRFAEARNEADLQNAWKAVQQDFRTKWHRPDHKLIFLIHDGYSQIGDRDVVNIVGEINSTDRRRPIDVILHTSGGSAFAAAQIASALVERGRVEAFVPIEAMSGGTEIALATRKIYLGRSAALGPLDVQYSRGDGHYRAQDVLDLIRELGKDAPTELRLQAREIERYLKQETKRLCEGIHRGHKGIFGWRGCSLAQELSSGDRHHGVPIRFKEAKRLGMNVSRKLPPSVYQLISARVEQLSRLRELRSQPTVIIQPAPQAAVH